MLFCPTWDDVFLVTISNKSVLGESTSLSLLHTVVSLSPCAFLGASWSLECNVRFKTWLQGSTTTTPTKKKRQNEPLVSIFIEGTQTGSSLSLSYGGEMNSANSTTSWPVITADVGAAASGAAGCLLILGCVFWHMRRKKKTVFLSFRRGGRFIHRMEAHRQKTSSVWNCRMWWQFELMMAAAGNGHISIPLDYCSIYAF